VKKILFALVFVAGAAQGATVNFDGSRVVVSTISTAPTLIFSQDSNAGKSVILNDSGFNLVLSTSSVSVSTDGDTGGFYLPTGTLFDLSGTEDYRGAVYGVISGTDVPKSIGRFRTK
jgi:hypothetical protein